MNVITENTKLAELMQEYPWLMEEAIKIDGKFRVLKTPLGKMFLKNATIGELSGKAGISAAEIIRKIEELLEQHGGK